MSSTNKTANLQLSQFVGTDIPSILTDYNGDMRKIDAGVQEAKTAVAGAVSDLSSVTARVGNVESDVTGLNSAVQGVASRVSAVEGDVSTLSGEMEGVQSVIPTTASAENKLITKDDIPKDNGRRIQMNFSTGTSMGDIITSINNKIVELGFGTQLSPSLLTCGIFFTTGFSDLNMPLKGNSEGTFTGFTGYSNGMRTGYLNLITKECYTYNFSTTGNMIISDLSNEQASNNAEVFLYYFVDNDRGE